MSGPESAFSKLERAGIPERITVLSVDLKSIECASVLVHRLSGGTFFTTIVRVAVALPLSGFRPVWAKRAQTLSLVCAAIALVGLGKRMDHFQFLFNQLVIGTSL